MKSGTMTVYRNSDVSSAFVQEFYSQEEDEEESGAFFQVQPWKTN